MLKKFADTLAGYKSGILACYDHRIDFRNDVTSLTPSTLRARATALSA
ncbi:MAG TPA: hypothetical protein VFG29_07715 [Syntrophales bacterium]|nr:hypothetical protein [Syntrophales bacterium]